MQVSNRCIIEYIPVVFSVDLVSDIFRSYLIVSIINILKCYQNIYISSAILFGRITSENRTVIFRNLLFACPPSSFLYFDFFLKSIGSSNAQLGRRGDTLGHKSSIFLALFFLYHFDETIDFFIKTRFIYNFIAFLLKFNFVYRNQLYFRMYTSRIIWLLGLTCLCAGN